MKENAYKNVSFTVKSGALPKDFTVEGAQHLEITETGASFIYKGNVNLLLAEIGKYPLANVDIMEPPLEDIFMHYYAD